MRARFLPAALVLSVCLGAVPVVSAVAAVQVQMPVSSNASVSGSAVVAEAERFLGYPYAYTGDSPATGFSCIGFVWFVYHQLGENIPGTSSGAVGAFPQVAESNLQPGDLVFFQGTFAGLYPSHVAIYIGGGKIIHSANPSYGVTISSIVNDPRDGNYWQDHYLSADRPWTGPSSSSSPGSGPPPRGFHRHHVLVVIVPSLNLRSGPSMSDSVLTVLVRGMRVTVEGWAPGWVRVSTAAGTVGWVLRAGVARRFGYGPRLGRHHAHRLGLIARRAAWASGRTIYVGSLYVRSAPAPSAPVIVTLFRGNRVGILARYPGWDKIVTVSGTIGWAMARYVGRHMMSRRPPSFMRRGHTPLRYGVDLRAHPSMQAGIVAVSNGLSVRVLRWAPQWVEVQLSTSARGWVWREFVGGLHFSSRPHFGRITRRNRNREHRVGFRGASVVEGVRIHNYPSLAAGVIAATTSGMRVRILGYRNGFVHVQTSTGIFGWIDAQFVGGRGSVRHAAVRSRAEAPRLASELHTTATVRLRAGPSLEGRVIGLVYGGTGVSVLRSLVGWDLVRLPNGRSGYVDVAFIAA